MIKRERFNHKRHTSCKNFSWRILLTYNRNERLR